MLKYKLLLIIGFTSLTAFAQSPYSQLGYGIPGDNAIGSQRAMGGVGYALHSNRQINVMNPASYCNMDSLTFLFDMGLTYQINSTREGATREKTQSGSLDYVAMQFPLGRYLAGSIGLLPYTNVGYSFINSVDNGTIARAGDGNISQAYVGVGGTPFKGFSLGANISYLFGSLQNLNTTTPNANGSSSSIFETKLQVSDFHLQFGAQYTVELDKKSSLTLGLVYSPGKALLGDAYNNTYDVEGNELVSSDTISMKHNYSLASTYGGGISYNYDKRLTIAADVTYQDWSKAKFTNLAIGETIGSTGQFNNRLKFAVGAEFRPKERGAYFQRVSYRLGGFYNRSYLKVNGNDLNEIGVSCGFGFPLATDKSIINVAFEYVNRQCAPVKLITENHFRISLSLTFNEMWFWQRKFD